MVFIVALYVPWCRYLSSQHGVTPQLYADNLKCTTTDGNKLLEAARFTDQYIRAVGQEASPSKCVLLSTSKATRKRMKNWSISAGDKGWGVKLDVRDLGGHLDITCRVRAGTLARRVVRATDQVAILGALPFGFLRLVGFARTKFLPAGLHGAQGSHISLKNLSSFRTGIVKACWPRKLPMANPQAVLSLLDAPDCCDPELYVIWNRFRQMRRYLAYRPGEVPRVYRLLDLAAAGRPGHGPVHLLLHSASQIGYAWDSHEEGWLRPGLPPLRMMTGPFQHFKEAIFAAWRGRVAGILTSRKGFRGGSLLDYNGTKQLLFSSHLRERDKMLLRSFLCGRAWNGFLLGKTKEEDVPCRFCGGSDGDGHLFWDCPSPPIARIREHPEFLPLMTLDRSSWPRCLAWHGWLLALSPRRAHSPWAVSEIDSVDSVLETALGAYPILPCEVWRPGWDPDDISDLADGVPGLPNIWTDGSRDEDLDGMVGVAGAGAYVGEVPWVFDDRAWGHAQELNLDYDASRIFDMVPGPLQTVQRAEYWGAILALQAFMPIHLGIDNKNVCNNVGRIVAGWSGTPFSLCTDGDLLCCIDNMIQYRSAHSVKVSKVKGHATDAMVAEGKVRKEDKDGNDAADIAADFGRLRQPVEVIDARRDLLRVKKEWYPRIVCLHRFMVAIARESINISDGAGSTVDPLCWDRGARAKVRRVDDRVLVEYAQLPGPSNFLDHYWVTFDSGPLTDIDVTLWPFSVPMLVKFTSFLSTLRWPEGLNEMGKFGVSYLEILILFEKWVGHRLLPEKTVPIGCRPGRSFHAGTSPVSEGVQLRIGCQFVGSLFRSLGRLPGGINRFIPGSLGASSQQAAPPWLAPMWSWFV